MIRRSAKIALRVTAVAVAGLTVLAGIFVWQASNGPVSLSILTPRLEAMINDGLKDFQLRFGDSVIAWTQGNANAQLQLVDVEVVDKNGAAIARAPRVAISLSGPALLRGEVAPMSVELLGVSTLLVRRADGGFQLGFIQNTDEKKEATSNDSSAGFVDSVITAMLKPDPNDNLSRYLNRFGVRDAKLTIYDETTRSYWLADGASFAFERANNGIKATVQAPLKLADKTTWQINASGEYVAGSPDMKLEAAISEVRLGALAASGAGFKVLQGFDVPASGNMSCGMSLKGVLGRCDVYLNVGRGELRVPALKSEPLPVESAALTAQIDFPTQRFSIDTLNWNGKGNTAGFTGSGGFTLDNDGGLVQLSGEVSAENIAIDAPNMFEGPVKIESMGLKASYFGAEGRIALERFHIRRGTFDLNLAGEILEDAVSDGVTLDGSFNNLTVADLKSLWPQGPAPGARSWVIEHVHEGTLRDGVIKVAIPRGVVTGAAIPNENMSITFGIDGMRATYLAGLPDLTKASGRATVLGDTFSAELASGDVNGVVVKSGSVTIPELSKHGTIGQVSGTIAGNTVDILEVINAPRLGYPARFGIKPSEAGGTSEVNFTLGIPMLADLKAEDIQVEVNAESKDLKLPVMGKLAITGGVMAFGLNGQGMKAHGAVQVNGAPMGITWTEDFTGTVALGTRMEVTATLNDENRAALGLDLRPNIEGKTTLLTVFTGHGGKIQNAKLEANMAAARIAVPELNWAKPEGEAGTIRADFAFKPDSIEIKNIDATGAGMKALGNVVLSKGAVKLADFKTLKLGAHNDFVLRYSVDDNGAQSVEAKGRSIDVGGVFTASDDEEDTSAPAPPRDEMKRPPLSVSADVGMAYLQGDVSYQNFRLTYADDGRRMTAFNLSTTADQTGLRGDLTVSPDGERKLRVYTGDAGRLLRGTTSFHSMTGGQMSLTADLAPLTAGEQRRPEADDDFDGVLKIERFKVTNQPFLARLFAAGSFTGLSELLQGEGVGFTRLEQHFQGRDGVITLMEGTASGPSIGFTIQGLIDRNKDAVDLNGTVVPLYGLNSMLEDLPLLGELLTSRKGEGIFGMTYGVSGQVDELRIAVNPISTLAPGIFRRIFQMGPTPTAAAPLPQRKPGAPAAPAFQQPSTGAN